MILAMILAAVLTQCPCQDCCVWEPYEVDAEGGVRPFSEDVDLVWEIDEGRGPVRVMFVAWPMGCELEWCDLDANPDGCPFPYSQDYNHRLPWPHWQWRFSGTYCGPAGLGCQRAASLFRGPLTYPTTTPWHARRAARQTVRVRGCSWVLVTQETWYAGPHDHPSWPYTYYDRPVLPQRAEDGPGLRRWR